MMETYDQNHCFQISKENRHMSMVLDPTTKKHLQNTCWTKIQNHKECAGAEGRRAVSRSDCMKEDTEV